ncbi:MAG: iron uptake porin [Nostoc sp. CreGUA01]|nr:iron uptake porin [Nostoc sp. CreGUA01]
MSSATYKLNYCSTTGRMLLQAASITGSTSLLCFLIQSTVAETSIAASGAKKLGVVKTIERSHPPNLIAQATENRFTSVSQLSDVQPSHWAYQALQSLVEHYGVVAGYLDSNYKGDVLRQAASLRQRQRRTRQRAMTRYEFAAGLNAALEQINELIAAGVADKVSREDLAVLQRLQAEFAEELAVLQGRIDTLEARNTQLETNQFSTTTKVTGQALFAVNAGSLSGDRIISPTGAKIANDNPNATVLYRASLDFNTSFFGNDLLKIRIDTGSNGINDNAAGVLEPSFGSVLDYSAKPPTNGEFALSRLYYSFQPVRNLSIAVGPDIKTTDFVDLNSYANLSFRDFSTSALVNNFILLPVNGPSAGAVINWNPGGGAFKVRALYAASDPANPGLRSNGVGLSFFTGTLYPKVGGAGGLFGDTYQNTVELEYSPSQAFALRLQYSGGQIFDNRFDVVGANAELAISQQIAVFGRYGYGSYADTAFGDLNPSYWMAGVGLRDLFVEGAFAGLAAGQPFIASEIGNATQTNFEAFYNFPINENIRVTPVVQVVTNPSNQGSNGTIVTGTLRTVFSF